MSGDCLGRVGRRSVCQGPKNARRALGEAPLAEADVEVMVVEAVPASAFVCFFPGDGACVEFVEDVLADQAVCVELCHRGANEGSDLAVDTDHADGVGFEQLGQEESRASGVEEMGLLNTVVLILSIGVVGADSPKVVVAGVHLVVGNIHVIAVDMGVLGVPELAVCLFGGAAVGFAHVTEAEWLCVGEDTGDGGCGKFDVGDCAALGPAPFGVVSGAVPCAVTGQELDDLATVARCAALGG